MITSSPSFTEPALAAENGWTLLEVPTLFGVDHSFVSNEPKGNRLRVRYFRARQSAELVGKAWFGPACEGPPGHAHGGSICSVMDEAMGGCAWMNGYSVLAAQLTVNFRKPLPLGTEAWLRAVVEQVKGRKIFTRGVLTAANETLTFAEAEGLFIVIDTNKLDPRTREIMDRAKRPGKDG